MTQVFFYHGASDKLAAACALIGKAHAQQKPMLIYAPEDHLAQAIDRLLWARAPLSFLPHCDQDAPIAGETPILIARQLQQPAQTERLMNLGPDLPPQCERFTSIIEVVGREENDRLAARQRFKQYKDRGIPIQSIDLSGK
ncbi:MAG: hypothetical protein RIR00_1280 [Pseudomonadota bacterium]|jgi:DNA polymerase-3 subunit chi